MAFKMEPKSASTPPIEMIDLTDDASFTKSRPEIKREKCNNDISRSSKSRPVNEYEEGVQDIPRFTIELDDEDDEDGNDFIRELSLSPVELEELQATLAHRAASAPLPRGCEIINSATTHFGYNARAGKTVELQDETFLRVKQLIRDQNGEISMKGILLRRARTIYNMLPKKCNELCAIIKARSDGKDPNIDDHLETRPLSLVISTRDLIFTNQIFPALSFRKNGRVHTSWPDIEEMALLVCRWKYIEFCDTVSRRVPAQGLMRLREHECDVGRGMSDVELMLTWHKYILGAASRFQRASISQTGINRHTTGFKRRKKRCIADVDVDLTRDDSDIEEITSTFQHTVKRINRFGTYESRKSSVVTERFTPLSSPRSAKEHQSRQTVSIPGGSRGNGDEHTFGDICAGAGGATRAAHQAGLPVSFVLDHDRDACATQRKNFPGAKVLEMSIFDFLSGNFKLKKYIEVTVLHISFPCQTYSTAHTQAGKNDDANEAAGYAAIDILEKCQPRVVTLEQTSNIVNGHKASFQALVHQLTYVGYNVRWKIVNFADTGNAHARNRLFMIASCPGEPLPPFPKATHGIGPGLQRPTTIRNVLRQVPVPVPHMAEFTAKDERPYDDRRPLKGCITTSGGDADIHPSGDRSFNMQELAQLAGFPAKHKFVGCKTSIRKQIGNAVPANPATPFFEEIVESLKEFDKEVAAWKGEEQDIVEEENDIAKKERDIIEID